jgi:hypothetical protein
VNNIPIPSPPSSAPAYRHILTPIHRWELPHPHPSPNERRRCRLPSWLLHGIRKMSFSFISPTFVMIPLEATVLVHWSALALRTSHLAIPQPTLARVLCGERAENVDGSDSRHRQNPPPSHGSPAPPIITSALASPILRPSLTLRQTRHRSGSRLRDVRPGSTTTPVAEVEARVGSASLASPTRSRTV